MKKFLPILAAATVLLGFGATACIRTQNEVDVKPIEIKPVHITLDINIKIEKALDDFFGDLDAL